MIFTKKKVSCAAYSKGMMTGVVVNHALVGTSMMATGADALFGFFGTGDKVKSVCQTITLSGHRKMQMQFAKFGASVNVYNKQKYQTSSAQKPAKNFMERREE